MKNTKTLIEALGWIISFVAFIAHFATTENKEEGCLFWIVIILLNIWRVLYDNIIKDDNQ